MRCGGSIRCWRRMPEPLKDTIANFKVFSEGLARNTGKLDGIVAGLEKMTGATHGRRKRSPTICARCKGLGPVGKTIKGQLAIPEPTAVAMLETQRILFSPAKDYPGFAEAIWADSIPKLLQARLIESFENYDIAHAPLRTADIGQADFQLLIDVRRFRIAVDSGPAAEIGLSARIVDKERQGRRVALVRGKREARQGRAAGSRRGLQRRIRPDCKGHDRLDRAGAVAAADSESIRGFSDTTAGRESGRGRAGTAGMVGMAGQMPSARASPRVSTG